jgi:hypothetical protein
MPSATIPATAAATGAALADASVLPTIGAAAAATTGAAAAAAAPTFLGLTTTQLLGASLATSLVGGTIGALGAAESAAAQGQSAAYQAQVAANNQSIAKNQAQQAAAAGETQQEQIGLQTRARVGAIEASQAASNIEVNQGSAVDVRSSAASLGELNALTVRSNTAQQVYGYQTAATSFSGQQSLAQAEEAQAPVEGGISAFGSLLSGASGATRAYAGWQLASGTPGTAPSALA